MAKVVAFNTNRQMNINANQERQLSRKFRCLSKEQKMDVLHLGFGYFRRIGIHGSGSDFRRNAESL